MLLLLVLAILVALLALAVWYMTAMPGERHRGPLQPLGIADQALLANLKSHVVAVASEEHNVRRPKALERSARYIEGTLAGFGYAVARQEFEADGVSVRNLEVSRPGPGTGRPRLVVIGAHYDSAQGAVGANDNGSGVAALLELARVLKSVQPGDGLEIRFVFYVNEELPWFGTERMGSYVHASGLKREGREVVAMLSLETIGWYSDSAGSQRYPFPFNLVGLESIAGVSWSDQWAYWKFGWPAVMVTDTAPYRYPHYHTLHDTPDRLDYDRLVRVVKGLEGVVRDLAGGSLTPP